MRSMDSSGGSQPCSIPELSLLGRVLRVLTRLPFTEEQGVLRGHAANTDITAASAASDDNTRDISQGIGNITVGFIFNLLF